MPDIILRGKAGPPTVHREGGAIVVKKTLTYASIEERSAATRLRGKTSMAAASNAEQLKSALRSVRVAADIAVSRTKAEAEAKNARVIAAMTNLANKMGTQLTGKHKKEINDLGFKLYALQTKYALLKANSVPAARVKIEREEAEEKFQGVLQSLAGLSLIHN